MSVHSAPHGWVVRWRQGGTHKSRTFRKKSAAKDFDDFLYDSRQLGAARSLSSERGFADVVDEWWASHHRTISESTRNKQRSYLEKDVLPRYEGHRLCDITAPEVNAFLNELDTQGRGAPTQRKILYVLSAIFTYAQSMGYVVANPVSPIKKPRVERQHLIQPFPPERVEELRGWFLERDRLEEATLISVLAYAGPRPEEAHSRLTWNDIQQTTIIFRSTKTGKDRSTRLLGPLRDDLSAFRQSQGSVIGPVFDWSKARFNTWRDSGGWYQATKALSEGEAIRGRPVSRAMPDASQGADRASGHANPLTERPRPYDLRHAFASLLAGEGRGTDYISRQLGNSLRVCESTYRHLIEDVDEPVNADERVWAARGQRERKTVHG